MDDTFAPQAQTPVEEAWHKEQERKKYDIIRIKNPLSEDFYIKYDTNRYQKVPGNSTIDVPRYIALRYITHMKDQIINLTTQKMHDEYMRERREKGHPDFKSKWEENEETYMSSKYPKTNDPKVMAEIISDLWVGLVYEFGRDVPPSMVDPRSGEVDLTPPEMKILEGLDKKRVDPSERPQGLFNATPTVPPMPTPTPPPEQPFVSPFTQMSESLSVSDVTNE